MDELKVWRCRGGHVMGYVRRNGRGIRQLLLLREAVSYQQSAISDQAREVEVMAVVEGLVMDVRCSVCGRIRTWAPGRESINRR